MTADHTHHKEDPHIIHQGEPDGAEWFCKKCARKLIECPYCGALEQ